MTERLYYNDASLLRFEATVVDAADQGKRVYLDRSAFYPAGGGQPADSGTLGGVAVVDVVDEEDRVAHVLAAPLAVGAAVTGEVDALRRQDHMQQHSGQHLLSAVLQELFGYPTLSIHLGAEINTIDIGAPTLTPDQIAAAEDRANQIVRECRPVSVSYEDAAKAEGLRKASARQGELRIVSIAELDRSACGGTHVAHTGAIGAVQIRGLDKIRGNARVEFLCGARLTKRTRRDLALLTGIAKMLSLPSDEAPSAVRSLTERLREAEKSRAKLALDLAAHQASNLYEATQPSADGVRRVVRRAAITDDLRALAQAFAAIGKACFLAASDAPPALLLAASADSGVHAGQTLKAVLNELGGRGGGNAQLAQGTLPSAEALEAAIRRIDTGPLH